MICEHCGGRFMYRCPRATCREARIESGENEPPMFVEPYRPRFTTTTPTN